METDLQSLLNKLVSNNKIKQVEANKFREYLEGTTLQDLQGYPEKLLEECITGCPDLSPKAKGNIIVAVNNSKSIQGMVSSSSPSPSPSPQVRQFLFPHFAGITSVFLCWASIGKPIGRMETMYLQHDKWFCTSFILPDENTFGFIVYEGKKISWKSSPYHPVSPESPTLNQLITSSSNKEAISIVPYKNFGFKIESVVRNLADPKKFFHCEFIIDSGCLGADIKIPYKKVRELGLTPKSDVKTVTTAGGSMRCCEFSECRLEILSQNGKTYSIIVSPAAVVPQSFTTFNNNNNNNNNTETSIISTISLPCISSKSVTFRISPIKLPIPPERRNDLDEPLLGPSTLIKFQLKVNPEEQILEYFDVNPLFVVLN